MSARNEEKDTLIASGHFRGHTKIRIQSVASSAGGTAMMAIVAQPYRGHLNGNVNDEFDMEECYAHATVAGTRAQSLTVIVSPLDMQGMIGMMEVLAGRAHTIHCIEETTIGSYHSSKNLRLNSPKQKYIPGESSMQALGLNKASRRSPSDSTFVAKLMAKSELSFFDSDWYLSRPVKFLVPATTLLS